MMFCKLALGNVSRSLRDYGVYFVTLAVGVCVFYAFNSVDAQSTLLSAKTSQAAILESLSSIIEIASVAIAVVLGFLVVYANRFLIKRRNREFGLYLTLGMTRRSVSAILVLETLMVGLGSLVVGLVAGFALSQGMLYLTAMLFGVTLDAFRLVFSVNSLVLTVLCFAVMFLVALVFNVGTVSRASLIDLMGASRKNERMKLRNLWLSVALFAVSVAMIGAAYWLLRKSGLGTLGTEFWISTALMVAGTFLFFYSLSGFLLRVAQMRKASYFKGLNAFVYRQLNSKVNSAFASISVVCIIMFFALTSACGGFALCMAFNDSIAKTTMYDVSFDFMRIDDVEGVGEPGSDSLDHSDLQRIMNEYPAYRDNAESSLQLDFYASPDPSMTHGAVMKDVGLEELTVINPGYADTQMTFAGESQINELRAFQGLAPIDLKGDSYALVCDVELLRDCAQRMLDRQTPVSVGGKTLAPVSATVDGMAVMTSMFGQTGLFLVVPDECLGGLEGIETILNVELKDDSPEGQKAFLSQGQEAFESHEFQDRLGYSSFITADEVREQTLGLSGVVTYLAIYIGFVFLIACAAILALQQLSEAVDSRERYALLEDLGAERREINRALAKQIGIYFLFPVVLALCHCHVALGEVSTVAAVFGMADLGRPLAITAGVALLIYGGYYLLTYIGSKGIVFSKARR